MQSWFETVFAALEEAQVRYVTVGGIAVVLHGYIRVTQDLDLVIDLEPREALRAIEALQGLGLTPLVPVPAEKFADPEARRDWIENKHMTVFSMRDLNDPIVNVDLFVDYPLPFEQLWERSELHELGDSQVRIASLEDLITIKKEVGRRRDEEDIEELLRIHSQ